MDIVNSNKILLSEATDSIWEGILKINELNTRVLVFEKEVQECSREMYRFE